MLVVVFVMPRRPDVDAVSQHGEHFGEANEEPATSILRAVVELGRTHLGALEQILEVGEVDDAQLRSVEPQHGPRGRTTAERNPTHAVPEVARLLALPTGVNPGPPVRAPALDGCLLPISRGD